MRGAIPTLPSTPLWRDARFKKTLFYFVNTRVIVRVQLCPNGWHWVSLPSSHYPIQDQKNSVQVLAPCFFQTHFNIILPSRQSLSSRFSDQNFVYASYILHSCYISCLPHPPWFDNPNNDRWLEFESWRLLGIFLFDTASRTVLGPTQPLLPSG